MSREASNASDDEGSSDSDGDNVDPALMDDVDIFMDDHEVFVSLGLRAEDEAARLNIQHDGLGQFDHDAQILVDDNTNDEPMFAIDKENPKIKVGETFPTMQDFRMALRQYAIKKEFQVHNVVTDKKRYRADCKANGCPWRIVANKLNGQATVEITMIPSEHECISSAKCVSSMASQGWVAERVVGWLRKNPALGAADLQDKLLEKYNVEVSYNKVWAGRQQAMDTIFGAWEDSFDSLFNFRAELLQRSPGSIFEIATKKIGDDVHFDKIFLAMKPCIDGFQKGCRPYLGIDSTALNGKYNGHLTSATALDGHNWMYPVAWAIFESESKENWTWFMRQLEKAIGHPPALAISTDACKGLDGAVKEVFPSIEHRECMRHLWANFKKKYRGDIYDKNMWPAARAYKLDRFQHHFSQVVAASPDLWGVANDWKAMPHTLAFIQIIPNVDMESFVHEYYAIERFRAAYSGTIPPMTDKSQWPQVNMGFKLLPPSLKRGRGRQRKNRFKASHEPGAKKQQRCEQCGGFGHRETGNCPLNDPKKRKREPQQKRKPKRPKTMPVETISSGSITRRFVNLVHGDHEVRISSSSTSSVQGLLVLSQEGASTSK